ncbi:MAG TPA: lysophospholipid acyltransferase family protein [Candidatus Dormibacteraeota bacterium]
MTFTPVDDLRLMRRGFHWRGPRPHSWPEPARVIPDAPESLEWARREPVRSLRYLIQRGLMMPVNELMTHPRIEGAEWLRTLDRPVIFAPNHTSHADTPLLLQSMPDRVRERTVVAAAADYFYERPLLGRVLSLYLNTFPFARSGSAAGVLDASGRLLRAGWNLLVYAEGTRTTDGRIGEFKPGIGHLAVANRTPVVPMFLRGTLRVMPKGTRLPLPAPVTIRIGRPLDPARGDTSKDFTKRIEAAVRALADAKDAPEVSGNWIDRWRQNN